MSDTGLEIRCDRIRKDPHLAALVIGRRVTWLRNMLRDAHSAPAQERGALELAALETAVELLMKYPK